MIVTTTQSIQGYEIRDGATRSCEGCQRHRWRIIWLRNRRSQWLHAAGVYIRYCGGGLRGEILYLGNRLLSYTQ